MAAIEKETDNFRITVQSPEIVERDDTVRSKVKAKPLNSEGTGYAEKIKIKGRTTSEYAGNIAEMYDLDEEKKTELKTELMKLKNDIRNEAEKNNYVDREDEDIEERFNQMLNEILGLGGKGVSAEKLKPEYEPLHLADKLDPNADFVVPVDNSLTLTDRGRERVKEWLGFESFDGDPEAEAQKQLEQDPLRYYLDSFNKIHKGDHLLKVWELISALSCTCADRQIHSWAVGPSGKGKSHLKRRLLDFLPMEMYERKESFSPKALQYKSQTEGSDFLNNKLVYFDEVGEDDVDNAIELMRLMTDQDQDVITHETVKDQEILTIDLDVSNITVWFTSVATIQDEQLKNRFILTNPDASSAQDHTVYQHQQNILNKGGDLDFIPKEAAVIQRMVRDIRTNTPQYKPIVPFRIEWKQKFNRRLYPFFYTLMGLIAKIHYKNRVTKEDYIFVTRSDFELAKLIWGQLIDTTVAQTDEQSIRLLKQLPENEEDALTRRELRMRLSGFSTNKVAETCDKLEETEELQLINTDYDDSKREYVHWAGEDVKKLVDNEPEIKQFNEETISKMVEESGLQPDGEIIENVSNAETPVYDYLKSTIRGSEEEDELEISDEEETVLQQMREYSWEADLNSMSKMNPEDDIDIVDVATDLEQKEVIHIDGENMPSPTSKLDELKKEGEVVLHG